MLWSVRTVSGKWLYIEGFDHEHSCLIMTEDQFMAARLTEDQWREAIRDGWLNEDGTWEQIRALSDDSIDMEMYRRSRK